MNKRKIWLIVLAIIIIAGIIVGIRLTQKPAPKEQVIKIGAILPLTGRAADMGQEMKRGIELAEAYWNTIRKNKKFNLSVTFEDSQSSPQGGINALRSLIARNYRLFIIPLSVVAMSVRPIIQQNNVIAFLDASHPEITKPAYRYIFRHSQNAEWEAQQIMKDIMKSKHIKNIYVFYLNDEYGKSFVEALKSSFGTRLSLFLNPYETESINFRNLIQKSRVLSSPESESVVITVGVGKPMGLLIKTLREQGYRGKIYAAMGYIATGARNVLSESERKNIFYTDLTWKESPALRWMLQKYQEKFGKDAPGVAQLEFQTVILIASAVEEAKTGDLQEIADRIRKLAPEIIGGTITEFNDIFPILLIREEK